jgi:crotonobetainyl-CoA:carnitine CoA-transferase CaiB-like acyl-CoA transferase
MRFSETPIRYRTAPPLLGQHTQEILAEFGLTASSAAIGPQKTL